MSAAAIQKLTGSLDVRAAAILEDHHQHICRRTDRMFAGLMILQWIAGIVAAIWISPKTWIGGVGQVHAHVQAAVFLGALIIAPPVVMGLLFPGRVVTRHVIAVTQMLFGALLIDLTGGRIETHFHVFGSLAFLAFYREWPIIITATVVVALDHVVRGFWWPQSVFGVINASPWRWVEHAGWVVFEDVFLIPSCVQSVRQMREVSRRQAELEATNSTIERQVAERTTELNHKGEQLREAMNHAEAANRSKDAFLANMSHEIRTPMTAILGFADLLLESGQSIEDRVNCVQTIRRNGEHLLTLINDILDISKIEAGKMVVERIMYSPTQLVADAVSLMRGKAIAKGLSLDVEFASSLPCSIHTDPTRLRQILLNLLGNAIKFTETGGVRLIVRYLDSFPAVRNGATSKDELDRSTEPRFARGRAVPAPPILLFEVVDTGVGMTTAQADNLFRPFVQADASTTRRFGGTGLGLSISRSLAQLLGGDIHVHSSPGEGSSFILSTEVGDISGVELIRPEADARAGNARDRAFDQQANADRALQGLRVLLAEDGPDNQRLISHLLRRAGAEVVVVDNGQAACEAALEAVDRGATFDVLLCDMQMPILDGYGAVSLLRARGDVAPIIALTAHAMSGDRDKCLTAGCDDFATKPVEKARLFAVVKSWADRHRARHAQGSAAA